MYTRMMADSVQHCTEKKWIRGNVCELGQNGWNQSLLPYLKSRNAKITYCKSAQDLWIQSGAASYIQHVDWSTMPPIQYDWVVNQVWLEEQMDLTAALKKTHELIKPGGYFFTNVPIGISCVQHVFTPNFWIRFAEANSYDIRYCAVGDEQSNAIRPIPMSVPFTHSRLQDELYKYRETWTLRLSIVMQKKVESAFTL